MQFFVYFTRKEGETMGPPSPEGMAKMGKFMEESFKSGKIVATGQLPRNTIHISLEKGKIPPQAIDLEEVVLGAMMIDKKGVDEVIDILSPDAFYKEAHQHIFQAIFELFENSEPIDLLTVSAQLKKNAKLESVGGDFYLISLTQKVSSSAHIEFHARIILHFMRV